jgi:hypothetical protein
VATAASSSGEIRGRRVGIALLDTEVLPEEREHREQRHVLAVRHPAPLVSLERGSAPRTRRRAETSPTWARLLKPQRREAGLSVLTGRQLAAGRSPSSRLFDDDRTRIDGASQARTARG